MPLVEHRQWWNQSVGHYFLACLSNGRKIWRRRREGRNTWKVKSGEWNMTCVVLPKGFGSFEDKVCGPRDARPSSLTARASLLHPQVLRPGRAESGAFRSTPALHMIRDRPRSVISIFSSQTFDTHILIMEINSQAWCACTCAPVQTLRHTCLSRVAVGQLLHLISFIEITVKVCEASRARHGALGRVSFPRWEAAHLRWKND